MDFAEAHCYMDDLPDEVFTKILNLVPIKQVIRCSIVSKRWDAACRYIIRTVNRSSEKTQIIPMNARCGNGAGFGIDRPR